METTTLRIDGMTCGGCVKSVTNVLKAVPGVAAVDVTLSPGAAVVRYDPAQAGEPQFRQAIEDAGFDLVSQV
jgi:copper chaperone